MVFRVVAKRPLLQHHEQYGFAGVSGAALRKLGLSKGWLDEATDTGHDEDDRLAISCLLSLDPTLTKEEVMGRSLHRNEASSWGEGAAVDLEEVVRDTMLAADQDQALRQLATRKASQQTALEVRKRGSKTYDHVCKSFASRPAFKAGQTARKKKEKQAEKSAKEAVAAIARHYDNVDANVDDVVKATQPLAVRVYRDDRNGRWKVSYSTVWAYSARSISWTAVGSKKAEAEAVRQGWKWAEVFEGLEMPEEAVKILKKLEA